jgi:histidyl-tRNA synthetase
VCGGGRYDALLSTYAPSASSPSIPAVGFGFGDAVIVELLRAKNLLPALAQLRRLDVMVAITDEDQALYARAVTIASTLRRESALQLRVDLVLQPKRMKTLLQLANRAGVSHVIVFSSHEGQEGNALVKSMSDGSQRLVADGELEEAIRTWTRAEGDTTA